MGDVAQHLAAGDVAGGEARRAEVGARDRVARELPVQAAGELPDAVSLGHLPSVTGGADSGSADAAEPPATGAEPWLR